MLQQSCSIYYLSEVCVEDLSVQLALAFGGDIETKEELADVDESNGLQDGEESEPSVEKPQKRPKKKQAKKRVLTRRDPVFAFKWFIAK